MELQPKRPASTQLTNYLSVTGKFKVVLVPKYNPLRMYRRSGGKPPHVINFSTESK
jgi:hypothetical protein